MSLACWTPGSAANSVFATWPALVAQNDCADAEGHQQLWAMPPAWRHLCQSPTAANHCYCFFGVAIHWLYQYWDNYGVGSTPKCGECFGIFYHFTKHIMAYMTPNLTAKTDAKFLWQGYISIFTALAKLLSDWGGNFESNIIKELCEFMGIWKAQTSPFHAEINGQVEWAHQILMCMIGKLRRWIGPSICQNCCMLTTLWDWPSQDTAHYFTFRHQPCLPVNFYFPMRRGTGKHQCVDHYVAELCE